MEGLARGATPPGNSATPPGQSDRWAVLGLTQYSAAGGPGPWAWTSGLRLAGVEIEQRLPDGLGYQATHFGFPMKLNLALGGVDVDVHGGWINFQKEAGDGVAPFHQRGVVAFKQREVKAAILHRTTVHKEVLVLAGGTGDAGRAEETPKAEARSPKSEVRRGGGRVSASSGEVISAE